MTPKEKFYRVGIITHTTFLIGRVTRAGFFPWTPLESDSPFFVYTLHHELTYNFLTAGYYWGEQDCIYFARIPSAHVILICRTILAAKNLPKLLLTFVCQSYSLGDILPGVIMTIGTNGLMQARL